MKFLHVLNQKKLAQALLCGVLVSGGMLVGMGQAGAVPPGGAPSTGKVGNIYNVSTAFSDVAPSVLSGVDTFNFYIPSTALGGVRMLTITDAFSFAPGTTINAGIHKDSELLVGDAIELIRGAAGLSDCEHITSKGTVSVSDYQKFGLDIYADATGNSIWAEIISCPGSGLPGGLTEESKSPVETQAAGLTMLNTGADMLAGQGFDNAATAVASEVSAGGSASTMVPFVSMGGAKNKVKSGSHVDVKGWNINLGFAKELNNKAGKLLIGPVLEYGRGSYDSYLDNGYHGDGDTKYIGGGVMAKQTNNNGFYYEGSLRAGKLDNDYKAYANSYDSSSTYFAAHLGAGKVVKLSAKNSLDYYGKYFFTHQAADTTTLHTPSKDYRLHLDGVNSNRTRIGGRFIHDLTAKDAVYVGLAWQHEFSGTARATIDGAGTPAPSVKGDTGIMELGWKVNANDHLDLDLGATGSIGKQKGAGLNLSVNFKF